MERRGQLQRFSRGFFLALITNVNKSDRPDARSYMTVGPMDIMMRTE